MTHALLDKNRLRKIGEYVLAVVVCLLGAAWVLKLWRADLGIPLAYSGDSVVYSAFIKGIVDNGWYYHNYLIGIPSGLHMYDFPLPDNFHFLVLKLLSLFTSNHGLIINLFFLLTFPLTTLTSLFVFRHFGIRYLPSLLGSLLFAFLPYHFFRGEVHLFYSAYYMVPLMVLVILWVYLGRVQFIERSDGKTRLRLRSSRVVFSLLVAIVIASTGAYYSFFGCFLLLIAGAIVFIRTRNPHPLLTSIILVALMGLTVAVNLVPSIVYYRQHGAPQSIVRDPIDAEIFGLKISQLLLPVTGHRVPQLAELKNTYNRAPLTNENNTATLGLIGSVGFLLLLAALFGVWRTARSASEASADLVRPLSELNLAALLFGTIGGFSSLFALLISPQIRSYNRISVYIAFFSLFAIVLVLDGFARRRIRSQASGLAFGFAVGLLLVIGTLDQTSEIFIPDYATLNASYKDHGGFVARIEQAVPPNSMIFQLPYMPFPEHPPIFELPDYDHMKAYLHSTSLRWTYGAIKGREGDLWQRSISALPLPEFVESLSFAGFNGIYVDRYGYGDKGAAIESELSKLLGTTALASDSGRLAFFPLLNYSQQLRAKYTEQEWLEKQELTLNSLLLDWRNGFSGEESSPQMTWRWCSSRGELDLYNTSKRNRKVVLEMSLSTAYEQESNLTIRGPIYSDQLKINIQPRSYTMTLTVPPGHNVLEFVSDAERVRAPNDPRDLRFRIDNFRMRDLK